MTTYPVSKYQKRHIELYMQAMRKLTRPDLSRLQRLWYGWVESYRYEALLYLADHETDNWQHANVTEIMDSWISQGLTNNYVMFEDQEKYHEAPICAAYKLYKD